MSRELDDVARLQAILHGYLTPHPELGDETDERGCICCWLLGRELWSKGARVEPVPHEPPAEAR